MPVQELPYSPYSLIFLAPFFPRCRYSLPTRKHWYLRKPIESQVFHNFCFFFPPSLLLSHFLCFSLSFVFPSFLSLFLSPTCCSSNQFYPIISIVFQGLYLVRERTIIANFHTYNMTFYIINSWQRITKKYPIQHCNISRNKF